VGVENEAVNTAQTPPETTRRGKVTAHRNYAHQDYGDVRAEHELFGEVCDSLANITVVLIAGPPTAQAAFRSYVEKHHTVAMPQVVGWTSIDHGIATRSAAAAMISA